VPAAISAHPNLTVFVSNLSWDTNEEGLALHFARAGCVVKAVVNRRTRRGEVISQGTALVEFSTEAEAADAIKSLNTSELDGRIISVREDRGEATTRAVSAGGTEPVVHSAKSGVAVPTKVFVNNLAWSTTSAEVSSYLGRAGNVQSAVVKTTKSGRSLGSAVVEFVDAASATSAIANLNGTELDGREIIVREFFEQ
jgi:RNA recognition motif-containing protein